MDEVYWQAGLKDHDFTLEGALGSDGEEPPTTWAVVSSILTGV
jgi:hypothetical protein